MSPPLHHTVQISSPGNELHVEMIYTEDNNPTLIIRQENFKAFQLIVIDFKERK